MTKHAAWDSLQHLLFLSFLMNTWLKSVMNTTKLNWIRLSRRLSVRLSVYWSLFQYFQMNYSYWYRGQPDGNVANCVVIKIFHRGPTGQWEDTSCQHKQRYICEKEGNEYRCRQRTLACIHTLTNTNIHMHCIHMHTHVQMYVHTYLQPTAHLYQLANTQSWWLIEKCSFLRDSAYCEM